jgi:hypothetical protein
MNRSRRTFTAQAKVAIIIRNDLVVVLDETFGLQITNQYKDSDLRDTSAQVTKSELNLIAIETDFKSENQNPSNHESNRRNARTMKIPADTSAKQNRISIFDRTSIKADAAL